MKQYCLGFKRFVNLNQCIFKTHIKVMGLIYVQCILGNFQYGGVHKVQFFMLANASTLKEYEIIMLIYNRKTCRLKSLWFSVSEDIILKAIRPCI